MGELNVTYVTDRTVLDSKKQDEITGQRSGICAWKAVLITARRLLLKQTDVGSDPTNYKIFKHLLEMHVLVAGVQNLTDGKYKGKLEYDMMQILGRSARKMMKSVNKLRYDERYRKKNGGIELLTKEQAREAYNICKQLLKEIEDYSIRPFEAYRPEINQDDIYSAADTADKIRDSNIRLNTVQMPAIEGVPLRINEISPTLSDDPQVFIGQFEAATEKIISYSASDVLKDHLITETFTIFGYASQEELWNKVVEQPELLSKALEVLKKLTTEVTNHFREQQNSLVPAQVGSLLQFYSLAAFLIMNQSNKIPGSILKSYGCDFTNFIKIEKEFGFFAQFDSHYQKNLKMLSKLNVGKEEFLFDYPNKNLDFKKEGQFESITDLNFLEKFLVNTPLAIENQIVLDQDILNCLRTPDLKLGTGLTQKTRRLRALNLLVNKYPESLFSSISDVELYRTLKDIAILCKRLINKADMYNNPIILSTGRVGLELGLYFYNITKNWSSELFKQFPGIHLSNNKPLDRLFNDQVNHRPQNELLIRYSQIKETSSNLHSDKELHVACAETALQIDHLIDYISSNPDLLDDPQYQIFCTSRFLEKDILSKQLQDEPKLAEKLFNFLDTHWKLLSQRNDNILPHLNSLIFLTDLTHRIFFYYAKDRKSELGRIAIQLKDFFAKIKLLSEDQLERLKKVKEHTSMPWIKSWISSITLTCKELVLDKGTFDFEITKEFVLHQAEVCKYLSQTVIQEQVNLKNKYLGTQQIFLSQAAMVKMGTKIEQQLSLNREERTILLNELLALYAMPSFTTADWQDSFPVFYAIRDGHTYKVNVLTGKISCDNRSDFVLPEWCRQHKLTQKLFEKGIWPEEFSPFGSESFQCIYQEKQINLIANTNRDGSKTLQIILNYQGREYVLLNQESNEVNIPLPSSLTEECLQWMSPAGDPRLVIFDKNMKEMLAHVYSDGTIRKDEKIYTDLATSSMAHVATFERRACLAWKNGTDDLQEIEYRYYQDIENHPLRFKRNANRFYLEGNPQLFITDNQAVESLRGYNEYLLLQSEAGSRYVVLPCYHLSRTTPDLYVPYSVIPLSENNELISNSILESLHIANIHFERGDFVRAHHYLKQAETSRSYTQEERKLLIAMIESKKSDPWASLTRIYATQQLIDNIFLVPPSQRKLAKQELEFLNKELPNKLTNDLENFVSNRNVPERYQPEVVLGRDRLIRLLQMKGIVKSIPVSEYLWQLSEDHYSELQHVRYPSKTPMITWEKAEEVSETYMWECLDPQFNIDIEYLMRPGTTFKNRFNEFYAQALSDDPLVRNTLKDRLNFMSHEKQPYNLWLAQNLLKVIKIKEEKMPVLGNLPPCYTRAELEAAVEEKYREEIQSYLASAITPSGEVRLKKREIAQKKVALNFISALKKANSNVALDFPSANPKPITTKQPAKKESKHASHVLPCFDKISYPPEVLGKEITEFVINNTLDIKQIEVLGSQEIEELNKKLKLNPYVVRELYKLNNIKVQKDPYSTFQEHIVGKWRRLAKLVHAVTFTIFTGGLALCFTGMRNLWWQVLTGKEKVKVIVTPEKPIDTIVSKHLGYTWSNKGDLGTLKALLQNQVNTSTDKALKAQKRILEIVNKMTLDEDKNLQLDLLRGSEKKELYTLEKCLSIFLNDEWHIFKTRNPTLTDIQINALHALIVMYLVENITAKKGEQALEIIKSYTTIPADSEQAKILLRELGPLLKTTRYYDINTNPAMLLFEYASGWSIQEKQVDMLTKLFSQDVKGKYKNVILQLIMGGGKSKVISPIQACMKADGKQLSLIVIPDALFETNRADFEKVFKKLFGSTSKCLLFSREDSTVSYLKTLLYTVEEAVRHRECILIRPKDLLCLDLEHWELRQQIETWDKKSKDFSVLQEKVELLHQILVVLKTIPIVDEADTVFHCKYQVNFTTGQPMAPEKVDTETVKEIYRFIATDHELRNIVRLHENKQHLLTDEQWEHVKIRLTDLMVKQIKANYKIPLEEKDLILYCKGKKGELVEKVFAKLHDLYFQNDSKIKEGIRKLGLLKREIEQLLRETLKKNTNTHYGLSKVHPEVGYAIPYRANNTPNEAAQFADADETRNKTFQACLSNWNESIQTKQLIEYTRKRIQDFRKSGHIQEAQQLEEDFKRMSEKDLFDPFIDLKDNIEAVTREIHKKLTSRDANESTVSIILDYVSNTPLQQQLKVYRLQLNGSTQDLESMFDVTQGYTGTLGSPDVYGQRIVTVENIETDLLTIQALQQNNSKIHSVDNDNPAPVLKELLERHENGDSFRAFIDCGALFKGKSNINVAAEMLNYFTNNRNSKKAVLYWDDTTNIPTLLFKRDDINVNIPLLGTSKEQVAESCKKCGLLDQDVFVYYDQRHTIGVDIFFPEGVKAFTTFNTQTGKDALLQGVMRMRKLVSGSHQTEFVVHKEELAKIRQTILGNKKASLKVEHLIAYGTMFQAANEYEYHHDAIRQMLVACVRKYFRDKILDTTDPYIAQRLAAIALPIVTTGISTDPFLDYGPILTMVETRKSLNKYASWLISRIKETLNIKERLSLNLDKLEETMFSMIDKQIAKQSMANQVIGRVELEKTAHNKKEALSEKLTEQNRELEQKAEREREFEQEKLKPPAHLKPEQAFEWNGDIFSPEFSFIPSSLGNFRTDNSKLFYLDDRLKELNFDGLIDKNVIVTEDFLKTVQGSGFSLLNQLQKGIYDVLIVKEAGKQFCILLSAHEAVFFKKKLADQKVSGQASSQRQLWLVNSQGILIQEGAVEWTRQAYAEAQSLIIQTIFLSGNIFNMNQHIEKLSAWIKQGVVEKDVINRKVRLGQLLNKLHDRLPTERLKLQADTKLQNLFVA